MKQIKPEVVGYVSTIGVSKSSKVWDKVSMHSIAECAKELKLIKPKFRPVYKKAP